jgi:hypothetical protein
MNADMASIAVTLDLPESLAREADAAGLLAPATLRDLIERQLRREAANRIRAAAQRGSAMGDAPLSLADLQAIVAETRKSAG